jgi:acyl carrier protein
MSPSLLVTLDACPLTPNGKVDRRALPVPEMTQRIVDAPFATPESDLEGIVASAWREVLNIDGVGIDDNFFDLGGHSLLTIQVMNRLKSVLGRDVPITDLFRFPTIRALARHLGGERSAPAGKGKARAEVRRASRRRRRGR